MNEVIGYVDVRSAEVATDAIASDVAQVHSDAADAHADALAAAASAAAAAGTLTNAVKKTGEASQSIAGDIAVAGDLTGGTVTVPTPVNNTDAASKKYVDDADALKMNIADVNSYAVGLTGNQTFAGIKTGAVDSGQIRCIGNGERGATIWVQANNIDRSLIARNTTTTDRSRGFGFLDKNGMPLVEFYIQYRNGKPHLYSRAYDADGAMIVDKDLLTVG